MPGVYDPGPVEGMGEAIVRMCLYEPALGLLQRLPQRKTFVQSFVHQLKDLARGTIVDRPKGVDHRTCAGIEEGIAHADDRGAQVDIAITAGTGAEHYELPTDPRPVQVVGVEWAIAQDQIGQGIGLVRGMGVRGDVQEAGRFSQRIEQCGTGVCVHVR